MALIRKGHPARRLKLPSKNAAAMNVTVEGFNDKVERRVLRELACYCTDYQCGSDYTDVMSIRIVRDIGLIAEDKWADCTADNDEADYPTQFTVRLVGSSQTVPFVRVLRLAAHEFTHVKHFATGELTFLGDNMVMWQNEVHPLSAFDDWHEPWEMEARASEKALVEMFCRDKGYKTAAWYQSIP